MQRYKIKVIVLPLICLITFFQLSVNAVPELPEEPGEVVTTIYNGPKYGGISWDFFLFHSDYFSGNLFSEYEGTPIFGSDTGLGTEKQCKGNPIMVQSGNKMEFETDYLGKGEFPLNIQRTYNKNWYGNGLFGKKWISNFGQKLSFTSYSYDVESCNNLPKGVSKPGYCSTPPIATEIVAIKPDGKRIEFNYNDDTDEWRDDKAESVQKIEKEGDEWKLTTESEFVERYNNEGQIIKRTSPTGIYHLFTYGDIYNDELLTQVTHSSGRVLRFIRNDGQLIRMTSENSAFDYTYNDDGYLASVTRAGSPSLKKEYYYEDSRYRGALTRIKVNNRDFAHFTYNDSSKGASTHHEGDVEKFSFEYGTSTTTVTNPLGHQSTYQYKTVNGRKKLDKTDRAAGTYCSAASSSVTYDTYGYIDRETDWKGYVTDFDYNAKGQLIKKTLGSGTSSATTINYLWLAGENKISEQSNADSKTTFDYASNGRLNFVEVTNSSNYGNTNETRKTVFSYTSNSEGIVTQRIVDGPRTDVNDTVIYDFDSQGNLTTLTNSLGQSTQYTLYDDAGNVGKITDPNGLQIDFTYDKANRVLTRSALNSTNTQTTYYDYNGIGKIDKITYPDNSSQSFIYDPAHRLIQKLNDEGDIITYEYTDNSDISSTTISKETVTTVYPCGNDPTILMSTTSTPILRRPTPKPPIDLCAPYESTSETDYFSQYTEYDEMARVRKTSGNNNQQSLLGYDNNSNISVITD